MKWNLQSESRRRRLLDAAITENKIIRAQDIVPFLQTVIHSGDDVVLEGCNQKQAAFLAHALTQMDPEGSAICHDHPVRFPGTTICSCSNAASHESWISPLPVCRASSWPRCLRRESWRSARSHVS